MYYHWAVIQHCDYISLPCDAQHCPAKYITDLWCTALPCDAHDCPVIYIFVLWYTSQDCNICHCTVINSTVIHTYSHTFTSLKVVPELGHKSFRSKAHRKHRGGQKRNKKCKVLLLCVVAGLTSTMWHSGLYKRSAWQTAITDLFSLGWLMLRLLRGSWLFSSGWLMLRLLRGSWSV